MASSFLVQIVHKATGQVVSWAPGLDVEKQFEDDLCARIAAKGVGVGRSTAHVLADVRTALDELFVELKADIQPPSY